MKVSEIKHNHSLTELLKVLIFSILMLLPFLSIGTRCLYVICNKNAYQSYSGTTIQYQKVEKYQNASEEDLLNNYSENLIYHANIPNNTQIEDISVIGDIDIGIKVLNGYIALNSETHYIDEYLEPIHILPRDNVDINLYAGTAAIKFGDYQNDNGFAIELGGCYFGECEFDFIITYIYNADKFSTSYISVSNYHEYVYNEIESSTLDNVFDYAIDQMTNSPTFNWTQNTALYTGVKGMTDNLQVQTNLIAVLIVYWTILTIIYIILDIVLKMFEWLTHGLIKKS